MNRIVCASVLLSALLCGCEGSLGAIRADDPTERGLSYIACAIVTAAVIRVVFGSSSD